MKKINQYIRESILDNEDDILQDDTFIIKQFLEDNYKIRGNYNIFKQGNKYLVDVDGEISLKNTSLAQLTNGLFSFNNVTKLFNCTGSKITTLEGAPKKVANMTMCRCYNLTDLTGLPAEMEFLDCSTCRGLTSLKNTSNSKIDTMVCCQCSSLKNLIGCPDVITLDVSYNELESLEGISSKVLSLYTLGCNKLKTLKGIEKINNLQSLNVSQCKSLQSLQYLPDKLYELYIYGCPHVNNKNELPVVLSKFGYRKSGLEKYSPKELKQYIGTPKIE